MAGSRRDRGGAGYPGPLGCLVAEPGEFTRRAFENGRLDLTEAEGLADLIDAETERSGAGVSQMSGALKELYEGMAQYLDQRAGLDRGEIDFPDEENPGCVVAPKIPALDRIDRVHG